jgi:hypothetical protein
MNNSKRFIEGFYNWDCMEILLHYCSSRWSSAATIVQQNLHTISYRDICKSPIDLVITCGSWIFLTIFRWNWRRRQFWLFIFFICTLKMSSNSRPHRPHPQTEGEKLVALSRLLCYLLRHGAHKEGLTVYKGGYLLVEELLAQPYMRRFSRRDLEKCIETSVSQR